MWPIRLRPSFRLAVVWRLNSGYRRARPQVRSFSSFNTEKLSDDSAQDEAALRPKPEASSESSDSPDNDNIEEKIELLAGLSSPWPYLSEVDERLSVISAGPHWPWKSNMSERLQERKVDLQAPENYTVNHFVDNTGEAGEEDEDEEDEGDEGEEQQENEEDEEVEEVESKKARLTAFKELDLAAAARVASEADPKTMRLLFEKYLKDPKTMQKYLKDQDVLDQPFPPLESLVSLLSSVCRMQSRLLRWQDESPKSLEKKLLKWHVGLVRQLLRQIKLAEREQRRMSCRTALVLLASLRLQGVLRERLERDREQDYLNLQLPTMTEILSKARDVLQSQEDKAQLTVLELLPALEALSVTASEISRREPQDLANRLLQLLGHGAVVQLLLSIRSEGRRAQALRLLAALAPLPEAAAEPGRWSPCLAVCLARLSGVCYERDALVDQETAAAAAFTLSRCGAWTAGSANYLLLQALRRDMEAIEAQSEDARPRQVLDAERISAAAGSWWLAAVAMCGLELEAAAGQPEEWAQRAPSALFSAVAELTDAPGKARALWALHALGKGEEELAKQFLQDLENMDVGSFSWDTLQLLRELPPVLADQEKQDCLFSKCKALAVAEREAFRRSARGDELLTVLKELQEPEKNFELGEIVGPFCLPVVWKSRNLAVDIDFHHCVVSPVLRREIQWANVDPNFPDLVVKEISLADWEKEMGTHRASLLQQILGPADTDESVE